MQLFRQAVTNDGCEYDKVPRMGTRGPHLGPIVNQCGTASTAVAQKPFKIEVRDVGFARGKQAFYFGLDIAIFWI